MGEIIIELAVDDPVFLELGTEEVFVSPNPVPPEEPLFLASEAVKFIAGDKAKLDDTLTVSMRLGEFDTEQKKFEARENLDLNIIDGGTFN